MFMVIYFYGWFIDGYGLISSAEISEYGCFMVINGFYGFMYFKMVFMDFIYVILKWYFMEFQFLFFIFSYFQHGIRALVLLGPKFHFIDTHGSW